MHDITSDITSDITGKIVEDIDLGTRTYVVRLDDESLLRGLTEIKARLATTADGGPTVLVVDLSGLERLSSATLAALLWARRTCYARGGRVIVRNPNRRCRDVLTRTGLVALFDIHTDRTDRVDPQSSRRPRTVPRWPSARSSSP